MLSSGSPTGTMPAMSIASTYQLAERAAHCLVEHRLAPEASDHDRRRDLPLAEAGDPHRAPELPGGLVDPALDFVGRHLGLHAHPRLGQLGDVGLH